MTLAEFLTARLDELEAGVREALKTGEHGVTQWDLDDIASKRAIIELHYRVVRFQWAGTTAYGCVTCRDNSPAQDDDTWPCSTILALASPYDEHPDRPEEWKV